MFMDGLNEKVYKTELRRARICTKSLCVLVNLVDFCGTGDKWSSGVATQLLIIDPVSNKHVEGTSNLSMFTTFQSGSDSGGRTISGRYLLLQCSQIIRGKLYGWIEL